ncbi:hemolysin family protein, partial [Miniimonas arenae]|uniref:hemolysin family protein n=1 Tax=Miniimonas arenae TaxID=676201 RepID=UPI0028ACC87E
AASTTALILCTLVIAYLSLVLGELVPKRLALQRSSQLALAVGPPLDSFATLMRPVIWLLSVSTNALVRLLGGDPSRSGEEMSEEELRSIVTAHEGLPDVERAILRDVFEASERSLTEVMRPRHEVVFLDADLTIAQAVTVVAQEPFSRYPVRDGGVDDILGFVHVRDLFLAAVDAASPALEAVRTSGDDDAGAVLVADVAGEPARTVRDLTREIVVLPGTNALLPAISVLRRRRIHIAVVIDEYGGTDGIVTLEDLVEELVGEIDDEHDRSRVEPANAAGGPVTVPGGLTIEDVEDRTGVVLPDGPYETVGGLVMDRLDRVAVVGDVVRVADPDGVEHDLEVTAVDGHRIEEVRLLAVEDGSEVAAPAP